MRKPSLQAFIGRAQGHLAEGCHPPGCGSPGGAPCSALLGARPHSHETSLNPNSGNMLLPARVQGGDVTCPRGRVSEGW